MKKITVIAIISEDDEVFVSPRTASGWIVISVAPEVKYLFEANGIIPDNPTPDAIALYAKPALIAVEQALAKVILP